MSPVQFFFENVEQRIHKDGWVEIIIPLITPIITAWLQRCLDNGSQLRQAITSPTWLQIQAINGMSRRIVLDSNVKLLRRRAAILAVTDAIQLEMRDTARLDHGDIFWDDAFNELATL